MGAEDTVGAVQLNAPLCGVSPPVTRRLVITEQASLAQLHAALQVAFGWSDEGLQGTTLLTGLLRSVSLSVVPGCRFRQDC
jgi:hypothetical protein